MPTNAFTINQHYLGHLPDCIKKYSPPRMYSVRPQERMIGMLKPKITSRSKPAVNSTNVMIENAMAIQFFRRCATDVQSMDQQLSVDDQSSEDIHTIISGTITATIDDENGTTATLKQLKQKTTDDFKTTDYDIETSLMNYYSRHKINCSNLDTTIYTGKQAIICGHVFSASDEFVKLSWPVDENARRGLSSANVLEWGDIFGTILLLFSHVNQQRRRIFCVVNLEIDVKPVPTTSIPIGSH